MPSARRRAGRRGRPGQSQEESVAPVSQGNDETPQGRDVERAIAELLKKRARFVLVKSDKTPSWTGWQTKRPNFAQIKRHLATPGNQIGIMPASIGTIALDGDHVPSKASWSAMRDRYQAIVDVPSRQADRRHMYVLHPKKRENGHFRAFGVRGQIRSANGYMILWGKAVVQLADAMKLVDSRWEKKRGRPDFFDEEAIKSGAQVITKASKKKQDKTRPPKGYRRKQGGLGDPDPKKLARTKVGARNETLFHTLRHWAYRQRRGKDELEWNERVEKMATWIAGHFETPLDPREIMATAASVANFCWTKLDEIAPRHSNPDGSPISPEEQARRGKLSGQARRSKSRYLCDAAEPWKDHEMGRSTYYARAAKFFQQNPEHAGPIPVGALERRSLETESGSADERKVLVVMPMWSVPEFRSARRRWEGADGEDDRGGDSGFRGSGRNPNHGREENSTAENDRSGASRGVTRITVNGSGSGGPARHLGVGSRKRRNKPWIGHGRKRRPPEEAAGFPPRPDQRSPRDSGWMEAPAERTPAAKLVRG